MMPAFDLPLLDEDLAQQLRSEAHEMVDSYLDTLLGVSSKDSISGIYVKGSAYKPWDSVIDYVPEISDVDIQIRFVEDDDARRLMGSLDRALEIAERALCSFSNRVARPSHVPRPQLLALNELERLPGYLPSPSETVRTLYGEPYAAMTRDDYANSPADDAKRFRADGHSVRVVLPEKVIDRPGHHAWRAISLLAWRVGPAGPRLLTQLGLHPYDAWSLNRSGVVRALTAHGQPSIAEAYADFYLAGWDGFRSEFRNGDSARRALSAVNCLFAEGESLLASTLPPRSNENPAPG